MKESSFGDALALSLVVCLSLPVSLTRRNGTFVLAAEPKSRQLAHNRLDDDSDFNACPIAFDGRLLMRSDRYLYSLGKKS